MDKKLLFLLSFSLLITGCSAGASAGVNVSNENSSYYAAAPEMAKAGGSDREALGEGDSAAPQSMESEDIAVDGMIENTPVESAKDAGNDSDYFVFHRWSTEETAEDGTELLYEYLCEAEFYSGDPELQTWVDSILGEIRQEFDSDSANLLEEAIQLRSEYEDGFYVFSNYQELSVGRHDEKVASINVLSSVYSGGAHSNTVQTSYNLDLENQRLLRLEDVLNEGLESDYTESELAGWVHQFVDEKFQSLGEGALFDDYYDTIDQALFESPMTPYWYFSKTGLVIYFNPYEIAPFAAGIIKVEVDYSLLKGILREEYFPEDYSDQTSGDVMLREQREGDQIISITVDPEGEACFVSFDGDVYQVSITENYSMDNVLIDSKILFSSDHLDENDVLEIYVKFDEKDSDYWLEYSNGHGCNQYILIAENFS